MFLWPLLSAMALWWAAFITALSFDVVTWVIAVGSVLMGFWPLMNGLKRIQSTS
jgi:hypothetical protein